MHGLKRPFRFILEKVLGIKMIISRVRDCAAALFYWITLFVFETQIIKRRTFGHTLTHC